MIVLLGRPDSPTDAVEDYCRLLAQALEKQGQELDLVRLPWLEIGWIRALRWLWRESRRWQGRWVLVQYTALSWSRRGFPFSFLLVVGALRVRCARVAIIFHDPGPYLAKRAVERIRSALQRHVMRASYRLAEKSILTVPLKNLAWLPTLPVRACFIPVGPTVPAFEELEGSGGHEQDRPKTVAVFGFTGGEATCREIEDIVFAMTEVARHIRRPRLLVVGRGSKEQEGSMRQSLRGTAVELVALGLLPAQDLSRSLLASDALLFVRSHISSQRTSAMAAIACGLPIVGYSGPWTGAPLTEAGMLLVPQGNREELGRALTRLLLDGCLWQDLHTRSLRAYQKYFSWDVIADRYRALFSDQ